MTWLPSNEGWPLFIGLTWLLVKQNKFDLNTSHDTYTYTFATFPIFLLNFFFSFIFQKGLDILKVWKILKLPQSFTKTLFIM